MSYFVDVHYESINKYGEELCGDKVEIVRTPDSVIVVLADGLGSGVKANILATLTSKIIGTMLKEGATVEQSVETIAHTLPICNVRKLAYSTFTILQIFRNGEAYLVEFDNPSVIFIRNDKVLEIPFEFRNINGKDVRESHLSIGIDDTITIISDGVVHAGVGISLNLGWRWNNVAEYMQRIASKGENARDMSKELMEACKCLYMDRPGDDATVVVVKISPHIEVDLMSGPPVSPTDDRNMVEQFMASSGKKVVCGGTTAQIVGRELKRPVETSTEYMDPSIPPIAYIEGIDLVTEGVLTLTKTVEILRQFSTEDCGEMNKDMLSGKDGATRLAKILIDECTHLRLFIGRAINPAHQNPNLPIDLSIKLKLLEELIVYMKKMGKTVEKHYY
ncbi:SpoIIE family protein phosphatase [Xylanivirga thermophila]|uniref:SpoIIE family protein phosphatase n=1 Tax=Xylanivirga thermophila TaxID=2496273 RepID=UPI00101D005F|nr:SpoIIE family protein phosphatase [Xylanivirga thermophila]